MESKALKELIAAIFKDEKVSREFKTDPAKIISAYGVTDAEKQALMRVHAKLGLVSEDSNKLIEEIALDNWVSPAPIKSIS